jgi:uncharacterized protein Yka (UPF0111/DUF47 family)
METIDMMYQTIEKLSNRITVLEQEVEVLKNDTYYDIQKLENRIDNLEQESTRY